MQPSQGSWHRSSPLSINTVIFVAGEQPSRGSWHRSLPLSTNIAIFVACEQPSRGSGHRSSPLSTHIAVFVIPGGMRETFTRSYHGAYWFLSSGVLVPIMGRTGFFCRICKLWPLALFLVPAHRWPQSSVGFFECNPHRDRALDHRHSRLELLLLFLACNPHEDRGILVRHSQLKWLFLFVGVQGWLLRSQPSQGSCTR